MNLCLAVKLELSSARIVIFKSVGWKEKIEKEIKFRNFQKRKEIQRNFTLKQNVKQLEQKLNRTATDGRLSKQSTFENFKEWWIDFLSNENAERKFFSFTFQIYVDEHLKTSFI